MLAVAAFVVAVQAPMWSQISHSAQGQTDKKANQLIEKAAAKVANARFTVTMSAYDGEHKLLSSQKADVALSGSRYNLTAADQQVICDGKTVWHWNKTAKEVTVTDMPTDDFNLFNPSAMLAGHERNFRAKYIRTEEDGTAVVDLQPRSARTFHKLRLFIEEKSGKLKRAEVHKYDSSREVYDFGKQSYGRQSGPFAFDSKAHPEVEVIDMR